MQVDADEAMAIGAVRRLAQIGRSGVAVEKDTDEVAADVEHFEPDGNPQEVSSAQDADAEHTEPDGNADVVSSAQAAPANDAGEAEERIAAAAKAEEERPAAEALEAECNSTSSSSSSSSSEEEEEEEIQEKPVLEVAQVAAPKEEVPPEVQMADSTMPEQQAEDVMAVELHRCLQLHDMHIPYVVHADSKDYMDAMYQANVRMFSDLATLDLSDGRAARFAEHYYGLIISYVKADVETCQLGCIHDASWAEALNDNHLLLLRAQKALDQCQCFLQPGYDVPLTWEEAVNEGLFPNTSQIGQS